MTLVTTVAAQLQLCIANLSLLIALITTYIHAYIYIKSIPVYKIVRECKMFYNTQFFNNISIFLSFYWTKLNTI